ncbi:glycosyltransferase family 4 protein [Brachybacterium hainanense]|uniref:Glycosyltransferase family 4 protein n=1 Tax=Brachybacterium hainanense TaxID=1541174 RepID=A0ABV6REA5_9MICO
MSAPRIVVATNNGDLGGGEVMLLNIAEALRTIGLDVRVIGPTEPGDVLVEAMARDLPTIALPARGRKQYMAALRVWRMLHPNTLLWCNGLVPSFATAGIGPRLVHLHQLPTGAQQSAAELARAGARELLVPSTYMASRIHHGRVLQNWTEEIEFAPHRSAEDGPLRVGFLGRLTIAKGVEVLARAMEQVISHAPREVRLVVAGENRFGDSEDDRRVAEALGRLAPRVEKLGWMDRGDFFHVIDLLVLPSVFPESFGLAAAEAMGAGIPVVISDAGALPEVTGQHHPWIARSGDAEDLAGVMLRALGGMPEERDTVVRAARHRWEERFSPDAGTRRVAQLLSELDSPRRTRRVMRRAVASEPGPKRGRA